MDIGRFSYRVTMWNQHLPNQNQQPLHNMNFIQTQQQVFFWNNTRTYWSCLFVNGIFWADVLFRLKLCENLKIVGSKRDYNLFTTVVSNQITYVEIKCLGDLKTLVTTYYNGIAGTLVHPSDDKSDIRADQKIKFILRISLSACIECFCTFSCLFFPLLFIVNKCIFGQSYKCFAKLMLEIIR